MLLTLVFSVVFEVFHACARPDPTRGPWTSFSVVFEVFHAYARPDPTRGPWTSTVNGATVIHRTWPDFQEVI